MSHSETDYIEICKQQLEDKFSFGNGNGYSQKDLELLSGYIEKEIGVYISLSTLKRLWKNDFKQGPQVATLKALVNALDYEDWQHFKLQNKNKLRPDPTKKTFVTFFLKNKGTKIWKVALLLVLTFLLIFGFLAIKNMGQTKSIFINGPVHFEVDKTLLKGVPNTAIFKYDVSNVVADSFFIQQSWNQWRREKVSKNRTIFSSVYFESGFHRAKLIANDSVIAMQPVHILSNGWEPHVYYNESDERFIDFHGESFIDNGVLSLPIDLLRKRKVDLSRNFYTRVGNSKIFSVSSNDFNLITRVKVDKMANSNCPWLIVQIVTEKHVFYVKLVRRGCEIYGIYKLGEIVRNGRTYDLSSSGQDIFEWQEIGIDVRAKHAKITINGIDAYNEIFKEDFGEIMGMSYIFDGKGSIDYVRLSDGLGNMVFEDDFSR